MTGFREEILAEGVRLICGDCREVLPSLGKVDAVVTDPPYGIGFVKGLSGSLGAYRGHKGVHSRGVDPIVGDDTPFDPSPLLAFENVLTWGANHYCHSLPRGKGRWLAWNKLAGLEPFDSFSDVEFAWHSVGRASRICEYMWKGGLATVKSGEDKTRSHPTQKPIGLMRWCIEQVKTPKGSTILDPFMGSGTTGVAAVKLGRRFIGIEIELKYFEIAVRRIAHALTQPDMFIERPTPAKQEAFL